MVAKGDRNTRFFHAPTKIQRKRRCVESLPDESGCWVDDQEELKVVACNFFKNLYTKDNYFHPQQSWNTIFLPLKPVDYRLIHKDVADIEIKNATFMMGAFKAPGPDG